MLAATGNLAGEPIAAHDACSCHAERRGQCAGHQGFTACTTYEMAKATSSRSSDRSREPKPLAAQGASISASPKPPHRHGPRHRPAHGMGQYFVFNPPPPAVEEDARVPLRAPIDAHTQREQGQAIGARRPLGDQATYTVECLQVLSNIRTGPSLLFILLRFSHGNARGAI
jgi:hypothetical protein